MDEVVAVSSDDFGDRMKAYERVETHRRLDQMLPIYARIDGRSFSRFTRGMRRPFDGRMTSAMISTTRHLVEATNARIGYTQSDEISLVWLSPAPTSEPLFGAKVQKLTSILASLATAAFHRGVVGNFGGDEAETFLDLMPHFDARVFNLPSKDEAANAILWRAMDARKNAIRMVAHSLFSHKSLQGVDQAGMLARLGETGVNFECYAPANRLGTFLQRMTSLRMLSEEELARIPSKHRPTGPIERSHVEIITMPPFNTVTNRTRVIFDGESPK